MSYDDESFRAPYQQPVNFNDEDEQARLGHDRRSVDHATTLSYPQTVHSGITVQYEDPYEPNTGVTRAQAIISEYRSGPGSRPVSGDEHYDQPKSPRDRKQSAGGASLYPFNDSASQTLTYFDENFNHYTSRNLGAKYDRGKDDEAVEHEDAQPFDAGSSERGFQSFGALSPLNININNTDPSFREPTRPFYQSIDYAEAPTPIPSLQKGPFSRFTNLVHDDRKYPIEQRIENRRMGLTRQRYPFLVPILTAAMIGVFIYELVLNAHAQGTPISFHPVTNYMLGPSGSALINVGARFVPCMKLVPEVPITTQLACLNDTANPPDQLCSLETVCGFGGFGPSGQPNQWFRFILPIFLHVGIVHILLNMLAQATLGTQVERQMGTAGFAIVYFSAGIFGNVLGGNFALLGLTSMGASGAIFGTVASQWVDLLAHWGLEQRPWRNLILLFVELIVGVGLGYIPGVDNFAHLGGFLMGLLTSIVFFPVISVTRRHKLIIWICRILALPLVVVLFVVLIRNFYTGDPYAACSWCRYLSCIPTASNNYCQGTGLTTSSTAF